MGGVNAAMAAASWKFADLQGLVYAATPEGLHLEYKEKQDPSTAVLARDDARAIAEAVSSFANSDGGVLVYGVRSERRDGADVAGQLVAIADADKFAGEVRRVVELNISPQIDGVTIEAVTSEDGAGAGFAVIRVSASDRRPHMSTAPKVHRYYRRGFTGSEIMTPSEIRDQILAVREAVIEPIVTAAAGGSLSKYPDFVAIEASILVRLRNVGSRLCREPFMRVSADCGLRSHSTTFDQRLGAWKTDYAAGMMIHVDDESPTMSLRYRARFNLAAVRRPDLLDTAALLASVTILPGGDLHDSTDWAGEGIRAIRIDVTFGAGNATARRRSFQLPASDLARQVLAGSSAVLRDMCHGEVGNWREDIFAALGATAALNWSVA